MAIYAIASVLFVLATSVEAAKTTARDLAARDYAFTFEEYVAEFGKAYGDDELPARRAAFDASLAAIRAHNEAEPKPTWLMGLSAHSDKSVAEWASLKGLHRGRFHKQVSENPMGKVSSYSPSFAILEQPKYTTSPPASLDWRDTDGIVTPVKDQGGCGSCWAFSATETIESAVGLATKGDYLPLLSPQQLVSCAPNPDDCGGTGGCEGSTQPLAFTYVAEKGMELNSDYPYKGRDGTCTDSSSAPVVGITGQVDLPTNNYTALLSAIASAGPIAISVDASWGGYESGIYEPKASGISTTIDHAVQLVGYGTENGKDYWLVRNSWGTSWGEKGYIRLRRYGEGKEPCGTDTRPADGFGCKGGPSSITVCGTSGMLSGSSYVTGAYKK
jgi:cathepsin L